ncbi:hypothetical protein [Amycolatopsis kentuckyensis]|uniref:hypothetical protein n=1 Tax=Amycolatopsis kentuckyensis TaxID=218823 RepID=UPI00117796E4|nr:hypothetical protein [Amycolatopsis kentuckyensis]
MNRTALLAVHDGTEPTLEAALASQAGTGVMIYADAETCAAADGQAALLTAVATSVRAFGHVHVLAELPEAVLGAGVARGRTLAEALRCEGASVDARQGADEHPEWPILLIGATSPPGHGAARVVLRASWSGWTATVAPAADAVPDVDPACPLAAIAAGALGVSEVFGAIRARPGEDSGFRTATMNLWCPGGDDAGPVLRYAPRDWWLVGLGHLGQAQAWVLSWLPYRSGEPTEIVVQDTDRTILANHSTGLLTPRGSTGAPKTRLVAAALEDSGFATSILERRLGADLRVADTEPHVALLGVDNLPTRRLTSGAGWRFAVDVGLGAGSADFSSMLLRRFPGAQRSEEVAAWTSTPAGPPEVPASAAFRDLATRGDPCGVITLAGTAVGLSFVGVVAACLAVAEACRELNGGPGHDILTFDLVTMHTTEALAAAPADVIGATLDSW